MIIRFMQQFKKRQAFMENRRTSFFLKEYFSLCLGFMLFVAALLCAADSQAASVTLAWDQSPDPVTGYKIYYGTQSVLTNPSTEVDAGNVLQTTLATLTSGTTYYFALKAYNAYGQSGFSNEVTYTVPAAGTTTTSTGTATSSTATSIPATTSTVAGDLSHDNLGDSDELYRPGRKRFKPHRR